MPLISFVVGAFENPDSLRTCLASILDQTLDLSQIEIVVCDNSIDARAALLIKNLMWMGGNFRHIYTAPNTSIPEPQCHSIRHQRCLYTATEIGVEKSTGDWLVFPNADSYYCRAFAERMLTKSVEDNLEFVYCDIVLGRHDRPYHPRSCAPANCAIDKTNFMIRRDWFPGFTKKWENYELADGFMVDEVVAKGIRHGKVEECLVCHN